ncbi:Cytosolic iron-sulfur protein assembly protein [Savitreella phatthalungensis]
MVGLHEVGQLTGHGDRVWHVSVQGPLIATASSDRTVRIYRGTTHTGTVEGHHKRSIRSCAWRPSTTPETNPVLATASFDSTSGIWDYTDEWECAGLLEGHENEVKDVGWSAGGQYLATCSRDKSVWIWDASNYEDPECAAVLQEHSQDVKCVAWHPREDLLATGSYDDTVRLWRDDGDDWVCCAVLRSHEGTVWSIAFDRASGGGDDGVAPTRLCSASADGTVRVWRRLTAPQRDPDALPSIIRPDLEQEWACEAVLPRVHTGDVYTVAWSATNLIATAGQDGIIAVYRATESPDTWEVYVEQLAAHGVHEINHLTWSDDGNLLYSAGDDAHVRIWSIDA